MAPPERKHKFKDEYEKEFVGIKRSRKGDEYAHCVPCNSDVCLTATGKTAISNHQKTSKHISAAKAANRSTAINDSNLNRQVAAAEGTEAYHCAKHALSFKSTDCNNDSFKKLFPDSRVASKYASGYTKIAAIITGVLAPYSVRFIIQDLENQPFSISIDSSNHKTMKLFPFVVRYFTRNKGIQVRLLDLDELGGETADEIYNWIMLTLKKFGLKFENLVAFCGDNVNTNFGGAELGGGNNVYRKLQAHKGNLVPLGCPAQILHNCASHGANELLIDIESIAFKLASHFRNSTQRMERFKDICDDLETWTTTALTVLSSHGPTRWTTLENVVKKLINLWDVFKTYFESSETLILRQFFSSAIAQTTVIFLSHILPIFNHSINLLQKSDMILPQLIDEMNSFNEKIRQRRTDKFFGQLTGGVLKRLHKEERESLTASFMNFYNITLQYVEKWFRLERFPTKLSWITLNSKDINHQDVLDLAGQIAPHISDAIYDEVTELKRILKEIPDEEFSNQNAETKWKRILKAELPNLYKLVSTIFSIPVSNAFSERVFSLCSSQWTDTRNSLQIETVRSLVQVKCNFDLTCPQMYDMLLSNPKLLKQIMSDVKYDETCYQPVTTSS